ncbi:midasin-like [Branchiostoma floridae]|uniref:Midasin-like n=1 Tax=Branchiostoma floridae TaxID=7739 RepID=A0A9J7KLA3_BRAFL|nr:midasin-like [Branchiostoma floridae]
MAAMENSMTPTKVRWKEPSPVTYGKVEVKQVEHNIAPVGLERVHSFGSESELDIHLASSRTKRPPGVPRGVLVSSSAAMLTSDGNITPRDIEKAVKTRARPRKEFEGTPFLSIDNISPGTVLARAEEEAAKRKTRKLRNALHSYGQRIPSSLGEALEANFGVPPPPPSTPRMANGWGQRSRSPMRKDSVPRAKTPAGSKRQSPSKPDRMASGVSRTSTRCTSVMSGQQVVYRSPNSNPRKPPHNIKAPFKQGPLPDIESLQERPLSPSEELKEVTARGVHRVKKALLREPSPEPVHSGGRLLKAKLKPLYPVTQLRGPTIGQCRGVLAERYEQEETKSKLKSRKAELLEQLRARQLIPESIHLTSEASEVTDSEEDEDDDDKDDDEEAVKQLDGFQDSDDEEDDVPDEEDDEDDIGPGGHPPTTPPPPCSPTDEAADFDFPTVNGVQQNGETKTEEAEEKPDSGKENRKKPSKKERCKENSEMKDRRKDDDEEGDGGSTSGRKKSGGPRVNRTGPNSVARKESTTTKPNNAANNGAKQTKTRKQPRGKKFHGPVSSKASKRSPRNPKSAWELKRIRQLKCGICGTFTYNMVDFGETTGYCICEKCHNNDGQPVIQDSPIEEPKEDTKRKKRRVRFVDDKPNPELEIMKDKWSRLDEDIMKSLQTLTSLKCYRDSGEEIQRHKDDNDGTKEKCNISSEEESDEEYFSADSDFEDEGFDRTKMAMPDLTEFKDTKVEGSDSGQGSDVSSEQGTMGSEAGSDVGQVDVKVEYTVKQKKRPKTSNVRPQDVEMICREVRKLLANAWGQETLKNVEETQPKPRRKTTTAVKEK